MFRSLSTFVRANLGEHTPLLTNVNSTANNEKSIADNITDLFPPIASTVNYSNLMMGFATSFFQEYGPLICGKSNWSQGIARKKVPAFVIARDEFEKAIVKKAQQEEKFFSWTIDWNEIENKNTFYKEQFNQKALNKYLRMLYLCRDNNIEPVITFENLPEEHQFSEKDSFAKFLVYAKNRNDIQQMAKDGVNSYRFSIEWSEIEPEEGKFNEEAINKYIKLLKLCREKNIEPTITLVHFTLPEWFANQGGFEKAENIEKFVRYATAVLEKFQGHVKYIATFNEPAVQTFQGYFRGVFPPFKTDKQQSLDVLTNILKAHVEAYYKAKELYKDTFSIGIVHNLLKFESSNSYNPFSRFIASFLNDFSNNPVMTFLKTGEINVNWSCFINKKYSDPRAVGALDFIGLNFYAYPVLGFSWNGFGATGHAGQKMSDMFLPIYPESFADAIDRMAEFGKPIFISEMGFCDNDPTLAIRKPDLRRQEYLLKYLKVFIEKINQGVNLVSLHLWTRIDNYEWDMGHKKHFGLFSQVGQAHESAVLYLKLLREFQNGREKERNNNVSIRA